MLSKINQAQEESVKAHIKEEIILVINEFYMEKAEQQKFNEVNLENLSVYLSEKLLNVVIKNLTSEKLIIEYKEYEIEINNKFEIKILGKIGLKVEYSFESEGYTRDSVIMTFNVSTQQGVTVTLITPVTEEGVEVVEENKKFKFLANGIYNFRILTSDNNEKTIDIFIDKIDNEAPVTTIELVESYNYINGTLKAKVTLTDEKSGVSLENSKWVINKSNESLGTDDSKYTGGTLTADTQEITSVKLTTTGSYYFHILATDNIGNSTEYISDVATIKDGYAISTPQDLQNIKNNLTASYYVVNNIEMSGFNFKTIGGTFTGTIDGQGHTISNLKINNTITSSSGYNLASIFKKVKSATFENILFKNVNCESASAYVGVIAGNVIGDLTIKKVGIVGNLTAIGAVGSFFGTIVGSANITFENCYAITNLSSGSNYDSGGFIGNQDSDTTVEVINCYWSGKTNTTGRTGSFRGGYSAGNNDNQLKGGIRLTNSFYNKSLFKLSVPTVISGKGLETLEFADSANFTSVGWDFENTWYMSESGYPELKFD